MGGDSICVKSKPHVVFLTLPCPGHLFPSIALGKFIAREGIKVTLLCSGVVSKTMRRDVEDETEDELDMTIGSILDDPLLEPEHPSKLVPWLWKLSPEEMMEHAAGIITNLTPPPCCIISDVFLPFGTMLEKKLGIPRHFLITMSAASLAFMFSVPQFAKQGLLPLEPSSNSSDFVVPGVRSVPSSDVWEYFHKGSMFQLDSMILALQTLTESFATATYLVNSTEEIEHDTFEAFKDPIEFTGKVAKVVAIGPLETAFAIRGADTNSLEFTVAEKKSTKLLSEVEQWLDHQTSGSVLYISFGTICSPQDDQIRELAHGLEASEQPFLWIIRPPEYPQIIVSKQSLKEEITALLPPGFEERTKSRGRLFTSWAPQPRILAHRAVGLFMSHCGWNSVLEAISTSTPILATPCFVDQWMNARLVEEKLHIGMTVKNSEGKYERGRIESVIRSMMEGEKGEIARRNVATMNKALQDAVTPSSGSSSKNLQQYVADIMALDKELNYSHS